MRYFLPLGEDPVPRTIGRAARIRATSRLDAHPETDPGAMAGDRLVRTMEMSTADARAHFARWEAEAPAHDIPSPVGVVARERSRPDRIHPGALRRQRLALAEAGDAATLAHWSVHEPPTPADELAWDRVIARLAAAGGAPRAGWSA
jgi:hypothetical protein